MAPKNKKKNGLALPKDPWLDLPQHLCAVGRRNWLLENVKFGSVTKSWRTTTAAKRCNSIGISPLLQLCNPGDANQNHCHGRKIRMNNLPETVISFLHGSCYFCSVIPFYCIEQLCGNLLITKGDGVFKENYYFEKHPDFWPGVPYPAFRACPRWIMQGCTLIDPNGSKGERMQLTNAIAMGGKIYALSLQGTLAVIEEVGGNRQYTITGLSKSKAVPSVTTSSHFIEYLIELGGEIFLVFLVFRKRSSGVDKVEVFQLQHEKLSWKKMESLGDRALFLGTVRCRFVTQTHKWNCRSNCVYFRDSKVIDSWWEYDMATGTVSPSGK